MDAPSDMASSNTSPLSLLLAAAAQAFSYPDEGIAATLGPLASVCDGDAAIPSELAESAERVFEASHCFADDTAEKLAYTRLFIGSLEMEAPPYASYYMTDSHTLNGRVAAEVEAVYHQFGLQLGDGEIAPPDHLRYLLAFLSLLAARYEETGEEAFAEAYADFRDAYIMPWFGQFEELVAQNADAPYYPALVSLIGNLLGK